MARRFGSKATTQTTFPGQFQVREGTFEAELLGMQIYWNDPFQKDADPELQVGFILGIDDPDATHDPDEETELYIHREQFVRLQVDDEGNFSPGGARAKAYKLISAFYGQDFDAFDSEFEWELEAAEFDSMESIADIPHRKDYDKNDEWLRLDGVSVMGEPLFGKKAMIQFGYAQKPDGSYSDRLTVVGAMAMPRTRRSGASKAKGKAKGKGGDTPRPVRGEPAGTPGLADAPAHVKWVLARLEKAGMVGGQATGFLSNFFETEISSPLDLTVAQAKTFKGLWQADDGEQLTQAAADWWESVKDAADDPDDDDEFEDEPVTPITRGDAGKSKVTGKMAQQALDDEFPPEEDLPF